tara:strand:- start:216 stop:1085 length:870 start_codon:yes stop_codon:yes gene_type:complete
MSSITAVIVNWNTSSALLKSLQLLSHNTPTEHDFSIVVVDNASSDDSIHRVKSDFPEVRLIANDHNIGFGAALNQGAEESESDYLLLMNADVQIEQEAIVQLVDFLKDNPKVAVVGPRLTNDQGKLQLSWGRQPSLINEFVQRAWFRLLEQEVGQPRLKSYAQSPQQVDWVLGACMLVRRDAFAQLQGMDPRYFMYFEEVDLCCRLAKQSWQIWYEPHSVAIHQEQASVSQAKEAMQLAYRRSQLQFYRQHNGAMSANLLMIYLGAKFAWSSKGRALLSSLNQKTPTHD